MALTAMLVRLCMNVFPSRQQCDRRQRKKKTSAIALDPFTFPATDKKLGATWENVHNLRSALCKGRVLCLQSEKSDEHVDFVGRGVC